MPKNKIDIKILYFASLRDSTQTSEEMISTDKETIDELYNFLNNKYKFSINKKNLKAAQNEEYVDFSTLLSDRDTIVFIPPVAGG